MVSVLALLVLVVLFAAAWAALVTLFTPPLTSGWREALDATSVSRTWPRAVGA
jgi:hypothetical protein